MEEPCICILGAGPSGIVTALKLKQLGYNPLLLDRNKEPGNTLVQSLSPGVFTLLETVGLGKDEFLETCSPIDRSLKLWNGELIETTGPPGFLTDRSGFDLSLRNIAKRQGISVLAAAKVISLEQTNEGWDIRLLQDGKYLTRKASFLVDASGKRSIIRGAKKRVAASTLAVSGSWENIGFEKNTTHLESGNNYWLWGAMLSDGLFHVTLFLDPYLSRIPASNGLVNLYKSYLEKSRLLKGRLQGRLLGKLTAYDVSPYYYENPADRNFIKVGDASVGLDPVSSQGIQSAMSCAIQAAIVINTIFTNPKQASLAVDFYQERQQELIRLHLEKISASYASASTWKDQPFWVKRIMPKPKSDPDSALQSWTPSQIVRFSPDANLLTSSCIIGDQVSSRPALVHPQLNRPIVFWESMEIARILETLQGRHTQTEWIHRWSEKSNPAASVQLFYQLKKAGVLVATGD
jgi:flavin-dependent dehydrogenase